MKIAVVTTGGTISCVTREGALRPTDLAVLAPAGIELQLIRYGAFYSENFRFTDFAAIADAVRAADADGVIVTHGTDTLVWSAATLSFLLSDCPVPVVLVSANKILSDPESNGPANLHGAFVAIPHLSRGVYVSYTNAGEPTQIHLACRPLLQQAFDDRIYDAEHDTSESVVGTVAGNMFTRLVDAPLPDATAIARTVTNDVAQVSATPARMYLPPTKAVVLVGYHSGTVRTDGADALAEAAERYAGDIWLVGGMDRPVDYGSLEGLGGRVFRLNGISPPVALAKAAVAYALPDPRAYMRADICGEFFARKKE